MLIRKFIMTLAVLFYNPAYATEIPWYFDNPSSEHKSSISANHLILGENKPPVIVAVIDSGVNSDHPSLKGKVLPGFDMVSAEINPRGQRSSNYFPDSKESKCPTTHLPNGSNPNHGTEVASIIAGNGEFGVNGINPSAMILPVKAIGPCSSNYKDLIDSILWAAGLHVEGVPDNPTPSKILNISMTGGSTICSDQLQETINKVIDKGAIIVSAAGNTFGNQALEPAICKGVISVGSVNPDNSLTFYSPHDPRIELYAPGGGKSLYNSLGIINRIKVATFRDNGLGHLDAIAADKGVGTSFSSPMVAGVIADILNNKQSLTTAELLTGIHNALPIDPEFGYRILNYEKLKQSI